MNVPRATSNCTVDNLDGGEGGEEVAESERGRKAFLERTTLIALLVRANTACFKCFVVQGNFPKDLRSPKVRNRPVLELCLLMFIDRSLKHSQIWDLGQEAWLGSLEARHAAPFLRAVPGSNDVNYCKCVIL